MTFIWVWQPETGKAWQISWLGWALASQASDSVVSSVPTGGNFVFCWNILKLIDVNFVQKCQICVVSKNRKWGKIVSIYFIDFHRLRTPYYLNLELTLLHNDMLWFNLFSTEDFCHFFALWNWEIGCISSRNQEKFNVFGMAYIMVCRQPTHCWPSVRHLTLTHLRLRLR